MSSTWGSSWLSAWGNSWGDTGSAPVVAPRKSTGGADYRKRPPVYDEKQREQAWTKAREAEAELRRSLTDLVEGRKTEARETVAEVQETLRTVSTDILDMPSMDGALEAIDQLQTDLQQMIQGRMAEQQMRAAIEQMRLIELELADDEEAAIVAILMAGV